MSPQSLLGSHWCLQQLVGWGSRYWLADSVTVSLEAEAEFEVEDEFELEDEFEVEAAVAFEAFAPHWDAAWKRARLVQVWGGCRRAEAWEAGL